MQRELLVYAYAIGSCVDVLLKVGPVAERETCGMRTENREQRTEKKEAVSCVVWHVACLYGRCRSLRKTWLLTSCMLS
jgi:hypothetical protein